MLLSRAFLLLSLLAPGSAHAGASGWIEAEGARVRLVTASPATGAGMIRGALEIQLEPGWKTYWRDPGDAGIPPTIEVDTASGVTGATLRYPAPSRFDDGTSVWAGYDRPVSLPVEFALRPGAAPNALDASLFLGVCKDICIPVQATVSIDAASASSSEDTAVAEAFAALPSAAGEGAVASVILDGKTIHLAFAGDAASAIDLFVAGPHAWSLGEPKQVSHADGRSEFVFDILYRPKASSLAGAEIAYTAVLPDGAVDGVFTLK